VADFSTLGTADPLTGLADSRTLVNCAEALLAGDEACIALLCFDLDRLKGINAMFGHVKGDRVLRILADGLQRALGHLCIAGRIGGGEFAALLPGCSPRTALAVADEVRAGFADRGLFVDGDRVGATVSVGVTTRAGFAVDFGELLVRAHRALGRAKALGGDRVAEDNGAA
jgi:diguanylate cyclase (GGDEF)-like protein